MSDEQHTKTPWVVAPGVNRGSVTIRAEAERDGEFRKPVAEIWHNGDDPSANAEFIVRAVNAHDQLVAALQPFSELLDIFEQSAGNRPKSGEICVWEDHRVGERKLTVEMLKAARAALSLATQDKETVL